MKVKYNIKKKAYIDLASKILNRPEEVNEDMFSDLVQPSDSQDINAQSPPLDDVDKIGIWKKITNEGFYERDISLKSEWGFWSGTHRIDGKSDKKRIVYLGESAARGMFYDPAYCPAKLLENMLNLSDSKRDTYDVIDLARTNMDYEQLLSITNESLKLSPDAVVIFAGNNWIYSVQRSLSEEDLLSIYNAELGRRSSRLEEVIVEKIETITRQYLEVLNKIQSEYGISVFFMLPEFNLIDWKSSKAEKIIFALPEDKLEKWLELRKVIESENSSIDIKKSAEQMIALDSTNPIAFEVLANFLIKEGDYEGALEILDKSKDTNVFGRTASKPRTHKAISVVLHKANTGINLIDLPTIFRQKKMLPNREIFLDYCHLTEKGIKVAMSQMASSILSELSTENIYADDIIFDYEPSDEVRGNAYVNAAIHNAHYGQGHDVLSHLCSEAAKISPKSVEFIKAYVDMASRKVSTTLCKGHEEIIQKGFSEQYGGTGILHKANQKLMDIKLVDSMMETLSQLSERAVDKEYIDALRMKNHGVKHKGLNLLKSFYSRDSYDQFQLKKINYFQSRDHVSEFFIVTEAVKKLKIKLTFRTPQVTLENTYIIITLGNQFIYKVKSKKKWILCEFEIDSSLQTKGVNVLKIDWPTKVGRQDRSINENIGIDIVLGELYPVFGEIHSLSVKTIE
ncbi:MAG: tetratricopeptide (TPR) repeat protein [Cyclobacteriaceae bacterium]|jgi:tetratricopeptide (TPR) repeat protein